MGTENGSRPVASTRAEHDVGEGVAALHAGVPELQERGTVARQDSVRTALPATIATTVRGLAAATAAMRASSASWSVSRSRSPPVEKPERVGAGDGVGRGHVVVDEAGLEARPPPSGSSADGRSVGEVRRARLADVLALVGAGVPDDDDRDVGRRRPARPPRPGRCRPRGAPRRPGGPLGARRGGSRPTGAYTSLEPPSPRLRSSASRPRTATRWSARRVERQQRRAVDGLVAEQHDRLGGGLASERAVGRRGEHVVGHGGSVPAGIGGVAEHRGHRVGHRARRSRRRPPRPTSMAAPRCS